jgi:hypothetical protein
MMINKEIVIESESPHYEVQEVSLLDAMLMLKARSRTRESSIVRAAEQIKQCAQLGSMEPGWPMTGTER